MPLEIDWVSQLVKPTSPTTDVDAQTLHDFIEDEMASPVGLQSDDIIQPEGKIEDENNPGVYSQIILILNSPWQIQFWPNSGYTRIYGGKIIGGLNAQPFKATGTAGDITVLESPVDGLAVVVETGTSGLTASEAADLANTAADAAAARKLGTNKAIISLDDLTATIYDDDGQTPLYVFDISADKRQRIPA